MSHRRSAGRTVRAAHERAVEDYFPPIPSGLAFTEYSRELLRVMSKVRLLEPVAGRSRDLLPLAGPARLPDWASGLLDHSAWQQRQAKVAAHALCQICPHFGPR